MVPRYKLVLSRSECSELMWARKSAGQLASSRWIDALVAHKDGTSPRTKRYWRLSASTRCRPLRLEQSKVRGSGLIANVRTVTALSEKGRIGRCAGTAPPTQRHPPLAHPIVAEITSIMAYQRGINFVEPSSMNATICCLLRACD